MKNKIKKTFNKLIKIFIGLLVILFIVIPLYIYVQNDIIANQTKKELLKTKLPNNTNIIDSISIAGKLTGSGNGMQYFGGILVKTDLSKEDLEEYYKQFRKNEWSFLISKQSSSKIDVIEHGDYRFKKYKEIDKEKYYIIYSWGPTKNDFVKELDLRGH